MRAHCIGPLELHLPYLPAAAIAGERSIGYLRNELWLKPTTAYVMPERGVFTASFLARLNVGVDQVVVSAFPDPHSLALLLSACVKYVLKTVHR